MFDVWLGHARKPRAAAPLTLPSDRCIEQTQREQPMPRDVADTSNAGPSAQRRRRAGLAPRL